MRVDPTSEQAMALRSHIGGTRLVSSALLGLVKTNSDESRVKGPAGIEATKVDWIGASHPDL